MSPRRAIKTYADSWRELRHLPVDGVMVAPLGFVKRWSHRFHLVCPDSHLRTSEAAGKAIIYRMK